MRGNEVKIYEGGRNKDVKCLTKELKFPVHVYNQERGLCEGQEEHRQGARASPLLSVRFPPFSTADLTDC